MKKLLTILMLLALSSSTYSQVAPSKYIVYFTDKNNSPYSISSPSAYLSQRAIERRTRQSIAVNITDLPVNPFYVSDVAATGVTIEYTLKWLNAVVISTTDSTKLNAINSLGFVASSKKVKRLHGPGKGFKEVTGQSTPYERGVYNYGPSYRQINMIGGDQLHNEGYKGQGMVIAVLDAGFENANVIPAFDSIRNKNKILGTWDFVAKESSVYEDHSHGTMVLSAMAAHIPGELVGTAPEASYWLLRSEDASPEHLIEETNWVAAAEFADSVGADIINSSLGYTIFDDPSMNHTYADMDGHTTIITRGADHAASKGILVVNSAGNSGGSSWQYIGAPADGDSVLTIGAVDSSKTYAFFSSTGPSSDGRIKPNVCAMGQGTVLASPAGGTFTGNGTSFSSPIIAGMAACLWQTDPSKSMMDVYRAIERSADRYNNPDNNYGYGIPNFSLAKLLLTDVKSVPSGNGTQISFYPNPFNEKIEFVVYTADSQHTVIEMFDLKGKLISTQNLNTAAQSYTNGIVNIPAELSAGMYMIRFRSGDHVSFSKLVKE